MMECKYSEKTLKPGDIRFCVIIADTAPDTFPTTGGISGFKNAAVIDTGSVIIVWESDICPVHVVPKRTVGKDGVKKKGE